MRHLIQCIPASCYFWKLHIPEYFRKLLCTLPYRRYRVYNNRLSGGTVIAPNGATEDNLTTEDTSSDGQITRQYYFGGTPVGTAILEDAEQQTNDAAVTGQKNMEAAQAYSASHTTAPYYIIGAIGAAFLLFFLFLMIKVIKS